MLNFDYKKRLDLVELNKKINDIKNFENNEFSLDNDINKKTKNLIEGNFVYILIINIIHLIDLGSIS